MTRALLSVPSHAIDGVIMGYFFGVAKEAELAGDKKRRKRYLKLSVFMPMIEHGIYDSALSLDADWIFVFFFLFVIAVDVWALKFVKKPVWAGPGAICIKIALRTRENFINSRKTVGSGLCFMLR